MDVGVVAVVVAVYHYYVVHVFRDLIMIVIVVCQFHVNGMGGVFSFSHPSFVRPPVKGRVGY